MHISIAFPHNEVIGLKKKILQCGTVQLSAIKIGCQGLFWLKAEKKIDFGSLGGEAVEKNTCSGLLLGNWYRFADDLGVLPCLSGT